MNDALPSCRVTTWCRPPSMTSASTRSVAAPPRAWTSPSSSTGRLPLVIGFVLLLTMLIMALTFRSVPLAIISTVLNLPPWRRRSAS